MGRRALVFLLSLCLAASLLPTAAFAEAEVLRGNFSETVSAGENAAADNEELFYAYLLSKGRSGRASLASTGEERAAASLDDRERSVYDWLEPHIVNLAAGKESSTEFQLPILELFGLRGKSWTAQELGVSSLVENNNISPDASSALSDMLLFDSQAVIRALLLDHPYELFWYDKLVGMSVGYSFACTVTYSGGEERIAFSDSTRFSVVMSVAQAYSTGYGYEIEDKVYLTELDGEKLGRADTVVNTAKSIVEQNAGKSNLEKLTAYKNAVCALTSYDYDAAADQDRPYGDPWQLLNVFDGNPETKVVCEGYAKAFQYLCDLSSFSGGVQCYAVSGVMAGGTGAGRHMWNLVRMDDGESYLADITNCDEGTVGAPDFLFLKGVYDAEDCDYAVTIPQRIELGFIYPQHTIAYQYDNECKAVWQSYGILSPSHSDYEPVFTNTLGAVSREGEKGIRVACTAEKTACLMAAVYDAGGRLTGLRQETVEAGASEKALSFENAIAASDSIKVFLLDAEALTPLAACFPLPR